MAWIKDAKVKFKHGQPFDYEKILKRIDARMCFFDEYNDKEKAFCIRHDEDWDMRYSLDLARAENKYNLKSIYYINNTCDYFDYSQRLIDQCKEIIDLGHQIGLHYNALEEHILHGTPVVDVLSKPLDFLRSNGIKINGGSAHGSKVCRDNKVLNFEIWKEFETSHLAHMKKSPLFDGDIKIDRIPLSSVGFDYDATLVDHASYISDSSGRLWGMVRVDQNDPGRVYDLIEYAELMRGGAAIKSNIGEIIQHFNAHVDTGLMHILIHPIWWVGKGPK